MLFCIGEDGVTNARGRPYYFDDKYLTMLSERDIDRAIEGINVAGSHKVISMVYSIIITLRIAF